MVIAITTACAVMLLVNALSLASEENGIYRMSGLQILMLFLWPLIHVLPYIAFLNYFKFELERVKAV